jgi:putative transposase
MSANQAKYRIAAMSRMLGVSPSGYYAWRGRAPSARSQCDEALKMRIRAVHEWSRGTYGAPRIRAELADEGTCVGHKRIARLMGEMGVAGVSRRKGTRTTRPEREARPAPDLLERDFSAEQPDQLWVADVTYVPTWAGFVYLAVVVDAFSRRVVGGSMANQLRTELVLEALNMALWQRRPEAVIHHSDQGC